MAHPVEAAVAASIVIHSHENITSAVIDEEGVEDDGSPAGLTEIHLEVSYHKLQTVDRNIAVSVEAGAVGVAQIDAHRASGIATGHAINLVGDAADGIHVLQNLARINGLGITIVIIAIERHVADVETAGAFFSATNR